MTESEDTDESKKMDFSLPDFGVIGGLDEGLREVLAARGKFETIKVGHALITQGQPHRSFSVVLEGRLKVSVHAHGDLVVLAEVKPGEIIGEMCVIDPQNASADVIATDKEVRLWTIGDEAFEDFVKDAPAKGYQVMKVLAKELCQRLRHNSDSMLRREETVRDHYRDNDY